VRYDLRDYEPPRGQDGGGIHDLYFHARDPHRFRPEMDWISRLWLCLVLLFRRYIDWILMVFPLWVLLISIYILIDNLRRPAETATGQLSKNSPILH
jgi:hypothetical protein